MVTETEEYIVILTASTSHAIQVERVLKKSGISAKLIPVPRHLSSDCGSSVRIRYEDQGRAQKILAEGNVPFERIETI